MFLSKTISFIWITSTFFYIYILVVKKMKNKNKLTVIIGYMGKIEKKICTPKRDIPFIIVIASFCNPVQSNYLNETYMFLYNFL